jgi:hypothetical protein
LEPDGNFKGWPQCSAFGQSAWSLAGRSSRKKRQTHKMPEQTVQINQFAVRLKITAEEWHHAMALPKAGASG